MIIPAVSDDRLLDDIRSASAKPSQVHIWWLGQSGFLLRWCDSFLLFDPYLSDSLTRKYENTDKPHVRMSQRVIAPEKLDFVNVVTSSHNHTDHLDGETLLPICTSNPQVDVVVPTANVEFAAKRLGMPSERFQTIDAFEQIQLEPFTIHAVPAAHEEFSQDDRGRYPFLGYVVQCGDWTVYHSGDTILYDGMTEHLSRWNIDAALLPINGSLPERRVAGNLWGREAAQLAHDIGARIVIPCHFDLFEFNTVSPDEFREAANRLEQPYRVLELGQRCSLGM